MKMSKTVKQQEDRARGYTVTPSVNSYGQVCEDSIELRINKPILMNKKLFMAFEELSRLTNRSEYHLTNLVSQGLHQVITQELQKTNDIGHRVSHTIIAKYDLGIKQL